MLDWDFNVVSELMYDSNWPWLETERIPQSTLAEFLLLECSMPLPPTGADADASGFKIIFLKLPAIGSEKEVARHRIQELPLRRVAAR